MWVTDSERSRLQGFPVIESREQLRACGVESLDRLIAASSYRDTPLLTKAIALLKYGRVRAMVGELVPLMLRVDPATTEATLCPVPLHWRRRVERGFNQSELLAGSLGDRLGCSVAHLLRRTRNTGHQTVRSREERFSELQNAFRVTTAGLPAHVVLIDDVATTGATLDACAKALKGAGVQRVDAWVVARG